MPRVREWKKGAAGARERWGTTRPCACQREAGPIYLLKVSGKREKKRKKEKKRKTNQKKRPRILERRQGGGYARVRGKKENAPQSVARMGWGGVVLRRGGGDGT